LRQRRMLSKQVSSPRVGRLATTQKRVDQNLSPFTPGFQGYFQLKPISIMAKYDEERRAKMAEIFDVLDTDDNGAISITELVVGLETHYTNGDHAAAIDIACDLKAECDKNDDDKITKDEFMAALEKAA